MYSRQYLQIPGPTNIPDAVLAELGKKAINHRGHEFARIVETLIKGLKKVFKTKNDILLYPSSGSGALEASIVNTLSPKDKVLAVNMGVFSQRYGQIAAAYGLDVDFINIKWGKALTPEILARELKKDKKHKIKAILLTHNETSTSVRNDVKALTTVVKDLNHPAMVFLDAVSSLVIEELNVDELGIDIAVSGSQKGLMLPGGLAILSVSQRAWENHKISTLPKWYWDFTPLKQRMEKGEMPYTPVISHFFALKKSLEIINEEGLANVINRSKLNAAAFRAGITSMGLELFVPLEKYQSNAVSAIYMPQDIDYQLLSSTLKDEFNVIIGGGLRHLSNKIFRVGHLGMLHAPEVLAILNSIEMSLVKLGFKLDLASASAGANKIYLANS